MATQSLVQPAFGPRALDAMAGGADAAGALEAVLAADELTAMRQVGIVDRRGGVAVHTGDGCIAEAGTRGRRALVVPGEHDGDGDGAGGDGRGDGADDRRPRRSAGGGVGGSRGEGGDVRGRQSAALLVVPAAGEPWQTTVDLRVEDHDDPIGELRRLLAPAARLQPRR